MDFRYMGFQQHKNERVYRFDWTGGGSATLQHTVTVDLALFLKHHIGIQEGPALCAIKLNSDRATPGADGEAAGKHELTNEDLLAYSAGQKAAQARRAEARRGPVRRKPEIPDAAL